MARQPIDKLKPVAPSPHRHSVHVPACGRQKPGQPETHVRKALRNLLTVVLPDPNPTSIVAHGYLG